MGEMSEPFNPKSPVDYMLGKLSEECSEIIQAIEKARIFGFSGVYPDTGRTNFDQIQLELLDFRGTLVQLNAELSRAGLPMMSLNHLPTIIGKINKIQQYSAWSLRSGLLAEPLDQVDPGIPSAFEPLLNP